MKKGLSIIELAQKVTEQSEKAKDYIANSLLMKMNNEAKIIIKDTGIFAPTELAHNQMAERLGIPAKYYNKMKTETPALLAENVNTWFSKNPEKRLIRTMNSAMPEKMPSMRAFLSDRYRPYDNFLVMEGALPILMQHKDLEVLSSEITETKLYIQAVNKSLQAEVKVGDVVQAGIVLSNSEVGLGSVRVETLIYRLVCSNGMIRPESIRKNHTGKRLGIEDDVTMLYANDTILADNKAFQLRVHDMMNHAFMSEKFLEAVELMKDSTTREIKGEVNQVIENVSELYGFDAIAKDSILKNLISGGDLTQYGLGNAITATANNETLPYDRVIELERAGGDIFEMPSSKWANLN